MGKSDEKVTLTRGELETFVSSKLAESKMTDDEKRLRSVIREEVVKAVGDLFDFSGDDDDDEGGAKGKNGIGDKGEPEGLFDRLAGMLGSPE